MSITQAQLVFYKPEEVSEDTTNGGRMTSDDLVSNISNNVWGNVSTSDRDAGGTWYRKLFCKADSPENLTLHNANVFIENFTPADDMIYLFPATQEDTQNDITGIERLYGCGWLDAAANAGTTALSVAVEDGTVLIFFDGDKIRVADKTDPSQVAGNSEVVTISGVPSVAGNIVTITLATSLLHTYASGIGSRVQSLYEHGDLAAAPSLFTVTSTSGTYDEIVYPPEMDNRGTPFQRWTLTFLTATTFSCVGDTLGDIGQNGSRSSEYAPVNPDFSTPYFTLNVLGWGGTFIAGDTITFTTDPAAVAVWEKRVVPPASDSLSGNKVVLGFVGESA